MALVLLADPIHSFCVAMGTRHTQEYKHSLLANDGSDLIRFCVCFYWVPFRDAGDFMQFHELLFYRCC